MVAIHLQSHYGTSSSTFYDPPILFLADVMIVIVFLLFFYLQVRVSQEHEHFLLNPFGLLYSEVTASSLIKVDMQVSL